MHQTSGRGRIYIPVKSTSTKPEFAQATLLHWHQTSGVANTGLSKSFYQDLMHTLYSLHSHLSTHPLLDTFLMTFSHSAQTNIVVSHTSVWEAVSDSSLLPVTDQYLIHSVSFLAPKFQHLLPVCFVIGLLLHAEQLQYFSSNEALENRKGEIYHI